MKRSILATSIGLWLTLVSLAAAQTPAPKPPAAPSAEGAAAADAANLEPGVNTSAPVSTAAPQLPARSAPAAATAPTRPAAGNAPARGGPRAADRVDLDATQITGNRELPKVLYIVPWKRPDLGDLVGRPLNSLLDEVLAPVDRDVFRRENRYYDALKPDQKVEQVSSPSQPAAPPPQ
jgi:hypothetical protein